MNFLEAEIKKPKSDVRDRCLTLSRAVEILQAAQRAAGDAIVPVYVRRGKQLPMAAIGVEVVRHGQEEQVNIVESGDVPLRERMARYGNRKRRFETNMDFFSFDDEHGLFKLDQERVEGAWLHWAEWEWDAKPEPCDLPILTVIYDQTHAMHGCYFLRVQVQNGYFVAESQRHACDVTTRVNLQRTQRQETDTEDSRRQTEGWPEDWREQLAYLMDVNEDSFEDFGVGGPLVLSMVAGVHPQEAAPLLVKLQRRTYEDEL
jgi:hypothetical protein